MDKRAAILAAISGAVVAVVAAHVVAHRPTVGQEVAQVIEGRMAPWPDAEAVEDERLTGDANEAGYRWAERRLLTDATDCPNLSTAFRAGCIEYVKDQNESSGR
jgi:hypothetical protein